MPRLSALLKEYAAPSNATSGLAGFDLEGQRRAKRRRLAVQLRLRMVKGDVPGHEFHGNQWIEGLQGKWNENADRLVPRGPILWTDHKGGGMGTVVGHIDGKQVVVLRKGNGGYIVKIDGWQWKVTPDSGTARFNQIPGDKITHTPAKLFPSLRQAKAAAQHVLSSTKKLLKQLLTDRAAHEAATSYLNLKPQPTEDQKHAGNYPKGHIKIAGMDISIENPAGSHRRPEWPALVHHYGYIRRTEGADGDHVDAFVRVGTPEDYAGPVHVVNQVKADGSFDEHKVLLGFEAPESARAAYLENYERGWTGLGSMTSLSMPDFKAWLAEGDTTKPLGNSLSRLLLSTVRRFA